MKRCRIACILLAAACGLPPAVRADTEVGGTISTNTKWTVSGSPYIVTSNVTVNPGVTLQIAPGVTVRVNENLYIAISGTLTAVGTARLPIVITANTASPTPGYWRSLRILSGSGASSQLAFVTVAYGGYAPWPWEYYGGIHVGGSSPSLDHVTVLGSSQAGVRVVGSTAAPTITNSTITGNTGSGVQVEESASVTIESSEISGNGDAGVSVGATSEAAVADTAIIVNTGYAFQASANTRLLDLTGLTVTGNGGGTGNAVKHLGGDITTSETWSSALEWHLSSSLDVQASGSLTIEPGAIVKVGPDRWIVIYGTLTAVGTPAEPIVITANAASPTPGSWRALVLDGSSGSSSQLAYVTVSYGGHSSSQGFYYGNLRVLGSSPSLDHVTVTGSSTSGLWVEGSTAAPTITNSMFTGNAGAGMWVLKQGSATIADSTTTGNGGAGVRVGDNLLYNVPATATITSTEITGNSGAGLQVDSPATASVVNSAFIGNGSGGLLNAAANDNVIAAGPNYWGSPTGPSGQGPGDGQSVSTGVLFEPWLVDTPSHPHYLSEAVVSHRTFNPDYDIYHRLDFTTTLAGPWSVTYFDGGGNPVRTLTGTGNSGAAIWDGRDTGGAPLPSGTYTYDVDSTSDSGPTATTAHGLAILDDELTEIEFSVEQMALQFNPSAGETVNYVSTVPFVPLTLTETLVIKNEAGEVVRTLFQGTREAGQYADPWDGLNDAGELLPDGPYFYAATATWGSHTMNWEPSDQYWGGFFNPTVTIQPYDPFDNQPMTVTYTFSNPGRVSLGLSPQISLFLTPGCDPPKYCPSVERYSESGPQTITWAGVDDTGAIREDLRYALLISDRRNWPLNAVMLYGTRPGVSDLRVEPPVFSPEGQSQQVSLHIESYQGENVDLTISFQNLQSQSVLREIELLDHAPGLATVVWDGLADNGMRVAPGAYAVTALVRDARGNEARTQILTRVQY